MTYTKVFDPTAAGPVDQDTAGLRLGDRGDTDPGTAPLYEYDERIVLAVNVALAAGRPLLVRGDPGTGKSSLARSVAHHLGRRFYSVTVSSRSTARDLLWTFDAVARLADAQAGPGQLRPRAEYLTPGALWWAFDAESARRRGLEVGAVAPATDPAASSARRAVVLIDEIDKADPDVPNDLLEPLGSFRFLLEDGSSVTATHPPLVVITTNEERDLPRAFLRRCVVLALGEPDDVRLRAITRLHFPQLADAVLDPLLAVYREIRAERLEENEVPPSVAELLDAVAACVALSAGPGGDEWDEFASLLLAKASPEAAAPS